MSNYTKTTDFGAKDSLPTGDSGKIIRGTEFETEFDAISTAIATKADIAGPTFTGTLTYETISDGTISITGFVDEDDMSSDSVNLVPTQQSVKAYVDSQVTAQDLDFQADTGGALSIDLDSEALTFTGGTGIDTSGSGNAVTFAIDSTVATLTGTQTLTNKTLTSPDVNTPDIDGGTIDGTVIGGTTAAAGSFTTVSATGNITVDGTVDGRDVATDGTKLDGIESGATADQTAAEIRTLVDSATDSNVFTDADHTKLDGIEANATADQTAAEIRTLVDSATDSNVFTDADHTKLDGIEAGADVTDTTNVTAAGAVMDSELTNETAVKSLDQGVATTDSPTFAGLTTTADVSFGDNDKAIFGAGSDLQIYHDSNNSYIKDAGTGYLVLGGQDTGVAVQNGSGQNLILTGANAVTLSYGSGSKLATTSTGIDVTGSVTADSAVIDNITIDGTEIDSSSSLSLDIAGNLTIDVDGSTVTLADGGVNFGQFYQNAAGQFNINSPTQDKDIVFLGNDGGSSIEAMRIDMSAGGNVGIGTSSPAYKLQVNGSGTVARFTDGTSHMDFYAGSNLNEIATASPLLLSVGGTERVRIDSSGVVQISNATPTLKFTDTDNNYDATIQGLSGSLVLTADSGAEFGTESIQFKTGAAERIRIDSSGNVGIGTSSPSTKLHLGGTAPGDSIIRQDSTVSGTNWEIGEREAGKWQIFEDDSDSIVATFMSSGNVGIGTSSPSLPLSVAHTSTTAYATSKSFNVGGAVQVVNESNTAGTFASLELNAGTAFSSTASISVINENGSSNSASTLTFATRQSGSNNIVEAMRIDSSGRVGIGTSSPVRPLHVEADTNSNTGALIKNANSGSNAFANLIVRNDSNNVAELGVQSSTRTTTYPANEGWLYVSSGLNLGYAGNTKLFAGNAERMRINSTGEVVITSSAAPIDPTIKHSSTTGDVAKLRITNRSGQSSNKGGLLELGGVTDDAVSRSDIFASVAGLKANATSANRTGYMQFSVNDGSSLSEAMRLDSSGNLLVGTTSTSTATQGIKLRSDLDAIAAVADGQISGYFGRLNSDGDILNFRKDSTTVGSIGTMNFGDMYLGTDDTGIYFNNGTDSIVPINTTNQSTRDNAISLGVSNVRFKDLYLSGNAYVGNAVTSGTDGSVSLILEGVQHVFRKGSAGSYAEYGRFDTSGNLLVGKTSTTGTSAAGSELRANGITVHSVTNNPALFLGRLSSDGTIAEFAKDGTAVGSIGVTSSELYFSSGNTGLYFDDVNNLIRPTNNAGALRDNTVDLGKSDSRFKDLYLSGSVKVPAASKGIEYSSTSFITPENNTSGAEISTAGTLTVKTGSTPSLAMTVDASGNLLVGTTDTTPYNNSANTTADRGIALLANGFISAAAYQQSALDINRTGNDGNVANFYRSGSVVGNISVTTSATAYNTSSDQRLKDNIVDAPSASDDIDAIQVRSFDWKADGSHQKYGMVAQELQSVAPEAVTGDADSDDMMGVDYSKLVPMMLKEIQSLRARVAQLEGEN